MLLEIFSINFDHAEIKYTLKYALVIKHDRMVFSGGMRGSQSISFV